MRGNGVRVRDARRRCAWPACACLRACPTPACCTRCCRTRNRFRRRLHSCCDDLDLRAAPRLQGREEILRVHINQRGLPLGEDVRVEQLAAQVREACRPHAGHPQPPAPIAAADGCWGARRSSAGELGGVAPQPRAGHRPVADGTNLCIDSYSVSCTPVARCLQTTGFTGADLANLVNEAALLAGRSNKGAGTASCAHAGRAGRSWLPALPLHGRCGLTPRARRCVCSAAAARAAFARPAQASSQTPTLTTPSCARWRASRRSAACCRWDEALGALHAPSAAGAPVGWNSPPCARPHINCTAPRF